jgi:alpha-glucosidase
MLALPGSAYVYQGEELGLPQARVPDDRIRDPLWERSGHTDRGRDGSRVPLPWSGDRPPYGFTTAGPDDTWLPQPDGWAPHTVSAQSQDPDSTLALYRAALRLRRAHPAPDPTAPPHWYSAPGDNHLAFRRGRLTCVVNLGERPLRWTALGLTGRPVLASGPTDGDRLPPDTALWLADTPAAQHHERDSHDRPR